MTWSSMSIASSSSLEGKRSVLLNLFHRKGSLSESPTKETGESRATQQEIRPDRTEEQQVLNNLYK
jgi:hypothetical protein